MRKAQEADYARHLVEAELPELKGADQAKVQAAAANGDYLGDLKRKILADREKAVKAANDRYTADTDAIKKAFEAGPKKDEDKKV